jgi:FAD dependent monooxygenase
MRSLIRLQMTPDLGFGANLAIESAISLANILHREIASDRNRHFTKSEVSKLLEEYQKTQYDKAKGLVEFSGQVTRTHSQETAKEEEIVRNVLPQAAPATLERFTNIVRSAPKLDYVQNTLINEAARGWTMEATKA